MSIHRGPFPPDRAVRGHSCLFTGRYAPGALTSIFAGRDDKFRGRNNFPGRLRRPIRPRNLSSLPTQCGRRACRDARKSVFTSSRERISRFSLPSGRPTPLTAPSVASYLSSRERISRFSLPAGSPTPLTAPSVASYLSGRECFSQFSLPTGGAAKFRGRI